MLFKKLNESKVNKILIISLSNIGDVVLTFPVIDAVMEKFPEADISVLVGPKGESLFRGNKQIKNVFVYDKHQPVRRTIEFVFRLRRKKFDLAIDLRNSAFPFLIGAKYCTPPETKKLAGHMRFKHLNRLKTLFDVSDVSSQRQSLMFSKEDQQYIDDFISKNIGINQSFVVVSPGAADHKKRWSAQGFTEVTDTLMENYGVKVVFVGDISDGKIVQQIMKELRNDSLNLSGRTTLTQLAYLIQRSALTIVNDSAPMHLASYQNVPVLALFGPTDHRKYGPWSNQSCLIVNDDSNGNENTHPMSGISSEDVLSVIQFSNNQFTFTHEQPV